MREKKRNGSIGGVSFPLSPSGKLLALFYRILRIRTRFSHVNARWIRYFRTDIAEVFSRAGKNKTAPWVVSFSALPFGNLLALFYRILRTPTRPHMKYKPGAVDKV